ncbi:hypothetical protein [Herbaspirillum sp. alder98]|uniref:hypothetical protein n=1 Tax=Herbaspirillum sp. alder98 TaxID=2913096 RepID=UPI001CD89F7B|nr:hypothetical protein [Herbaspirillum sp. alder98]MCA1324585.1 hypothetical protein [Herbaspirillum sp. alder98]
MHPYQLQHTFTTKENTMRIHAFYLVAIVTLLASSGAQAATVGSVFSTIGEGLFMVFRVIAGVGH